MAQVPVSSLIQLFQKMYREHWKYIWGAAEEGCVDCSGAFDYAFEQLHGINYPHGSNTVARSFIVGDLLPVSEAKPGMAAFKFYAPGQKGYDLPGKFKPGGSAYNGDLNDYYHIGLVDEDPDYVLNAKGKDYGFCRDPLKGKYKWHRVAYLKGVDYWKTASDEKGDIPMQEAKVVLPSGAKGDTVNLRKEPSTSAALVTRVPVGSTVTMEEDLGQWCRIICGLKTGYMMSNYLEYVGQADETDSLTAEQREQIDSALKQIELATELIGSIIGRG